MPRYRRRRSSRRRRTGGFNFGSFAKDLIAAVPTLINAGTGIYNAYKKNKTSGLFRKRGPRPPPRRRTGGPPGPPEPPRRPPPGGPTMGIFIPAKRAPPRRRRTHGIYDMISRRG